MQHCTIKVQLGLPEGRSPQEAAFDLLKVLQSSQEVDEDNFPYRIMKVNSEE